MTKGALLFLVLGALSLVAYSCPLAAYHACVESDKPKKCIAVEVCEKPKKELCGKYYCEYPYTCASIKKSVCKDFLKLKQKCEIKKECKEVKIPCGKGACKITHDCVKENVCYIKKVPIGRKLMGDATANSVAIAADDSSATANSKAFAYDDSDATANSKAVAYDGSTAEANSLAVAKDDSTAEANSFAFAKDGSDSKSDAKAFAFGEKEKEKKPGFIYIKEKEEKEVKPVFHVKKYKEILVCDDKFTCVAKEPCKDVIIKKCVKDVKKPGIDVCDGGFDFFWYGGETAEKCGEEYCGLGYKCAEVIIKKCLKTCGDDYCDEGEECVTADAECEDYPYLEKVCKDVYEPTCVPLTPYLKLHYKAPCKTIFKCEEEPSECGGKYCQKGYTCAVDYKKSCEVAVKPTVTVVEKPYVIYDKPKKVVPVIDVKPEPKKDSASYAKSTSSASKGKTDTDTLALSKGDGKAAAGAVAFGKDSFSGSKSASSNEGSIALTKGAAGLFGEADATAEAAHFD